MRAAHYCSRSRFRPSSQLVGTTMPSADFCRPVRIDHSTLSPDFETNGRSPEVSSTAFRTQPSDLQPVPLMDMGFAIIRPLARHRMPHIRFLFIGSRVCSTLLSDPASRRRRCASLSLHLHQVVKRTFTSKLSNMLGTRKCTVDLQNRSTVRLLLWDLVRRLVLDIQFGNFIDEIAALVTVWELVSFCAQCFKLSHN